MFIDSHCMPLAAQKLPANFCGQPVLAAAETPRKQKGALKPIRNPERTPSSVQALECTSGLTPCLLLPRISVAQVGSNQRVLLAGYLRSQDERSKKGPSLALPCLQPCVWKETHTKSRMNKYLPATSRHMP